MSQAVAVVMGDIDLVRALAAAGVKSALFAEPRAPARLSRYVVARLEWHDHWRETEAVARTLLDFAAGQAKPPVLMPQTDGDLVAVSRERERLDPACRFLLATPSLVDALVDKERFAALAAELGLPVPPSRRVDPARDSPADLDLRFPLVVKPVVRDHTRWSRVEGAAKAVDVADSAALAKLWPRLSELGAEVVAQELVAGPESAIESYHAYVDAAGDLVAGFTGKKIRTRPSRFGHTTALEITRVDDVAALGQEVLEALGLRGVAKVDFKRAADGSLHLLEVNPRFNLWHHPGALAGVNLPALVYADLTGRLRPRIAPIRPGVRWCLPLGDVRAARGEGVGMGAWLRFLRTCEARSGMALADPLPFFPGAVWEPLARRLGR
jgi:predicted ATP-grasp superfamily ATP-dependent carboligase